MTVLSSIVAADERSTLDTRRVCEPSSPTPDLPLAHYRGRSRCRLGNQIRRRAAGA